MNCVADARGCTFALDKIKILEHTLYNYGKMRDATLSADMTKHIDAHVIHEDVIVIERKMMDAALRMTMLKKCSVV